MEIFLYCKSQIFCLIILVTIGIIYIFEGLRLRKLTGTNNCNKYFDILFVVSEVAIILDGITAYTAEFADKVPRNVNLCLHFVFYLAYIAFAVIYFLYWLNQAELVPDTLLRKISVYAPAAVGVGVMLAFMKDVVFERGAHISYSMGISVYVCFVTVAVYMIRAYISFFLHCNSYVKKSNKNSLTASLCVAAAVIVVQLILKETLVSALAIMLIILAIYLGIENPYIKVSELFHTEMIYGFSTLLDCKDGGTGGHIRRTSEYAVEIAKNLSHTKKYSSQINHSYISALRVAAPMHDIGKMSIPDNILQKPGKLTDEEFAIMKTHSSEGARIIHETFKHLKENNDLSMPYLVALYHHEKFNGKGYPKGISGYDIPLCARIMAVADVFDAVSAKRCYRDAMPLEKCFSIIREGRGTDFDPDVVDAFFEIEDKIIDIYERLKTH